MNQFQLRLRYVDLGGGQPHILQVSTRFDENSEWSPFDTVPAEAIPVVDANDVHVMAPVYGHRPRPH